MKKIFLLAIALVLNCHIALASNPHEYYWWNTATVEDVQNEMAKDPEYSKKIFLELAVVESPYPEVIKLLLQDGADINVRDYCNRTILIKAAMNRNPEIFKIFKDKGFNVNAKDCRRETALMWAARRGSSDTVKMLIAVGADVNAKSKDGITALMLASDKGIFGQPDAVKALLDAGADVNAKDKKGRTAWYYAYKGGNPQIEKLLKEYGAKTGMQSIKYHVNKIIKAILEPIGILFVLIIFGGYGPSVIVFFGVIIIFFMVLRLLWKCR